MRTPAIVLAVLLAVVVVTAANVTLAPTSIYETNTVWETIDINNYQSNSLILEVEVNSPTLPVTDAKDYSGWTMSYDSDSALWEDGTIETNVQSALFEFEVSAPNVTADTNATITVSLDSSPTAYIITILNDATPPDITNITPIGYAMANNPTQLVSAAITDDETGVSDASYTFNDCSGADTSVGLTKVSNIYSGTANFSSYDEGEKACYTISATNNAGETGTVSGELLFDGTPPSVTIISPTTYATESTTFTFNATDNIATLLTCTIELDNNNIATIIATNNTLTTSTQDLTNATQGSTTWSVTCADGVGLTATHSTAIIVDTEAPLVVFDSSSAILRTQPTTIEFTVTDVVSVATVDATYNGIPVNLTKSGNQYSTIISSNTLGTDNFVITATDDAGHVTTYTEPITTVPNHQLTLDISPSSASPEATITATITLTTDGNVSSTTATLLVPGGNATLDLSSGADTATFTAPDSGAHTITVEYTEAGHTYTAQATLTITSSSSSESQSYSSGQGFDAWRYNGGIKPEDDTSGGSNAVVPDEPVQEETAPEELANYEPLPAEEPREAFTPKATGVFNLGGTIKWLSILLAIGLLAGIGIYSYNKRKPEDGVNWDGYFK